MRRRNEVVNLEFDVGIMCLLLGASFAIGNLVSNGIDNQGMVLHGIQV
jgi:hypothetical protein